MGRVGTIISIIAVSIALGILLLSFAATKQDVHLPQDNGTHIGYPVWHPPMPGYYGEKQDSAIMIGLILITVTGYFAYKWTLFDTEANEELITYFIDIAANKTPALEFDRLLALYALITNMTGLAFLIFDIGKMWSTFGIFHNAIEVVILFTLHQGGSIRSQSFLAWMIFYIVGTVILSICLEWPYDSLWFKMQGLSQDYVILIQFTRIYWNTRKGYGDETHQRLFDIERPRHDHTSSESNSNSMGLFQFSLILYFLIIFGNVYITLWYYKTHAYLLLSFSYCITFPIYCYYVYLDTHSVATPPTQKYVILPDNGKLKVILVVLSSIFLSFLSARISLIIESHANNDN